MIFVVLCTTRFLIHFQIKQKPNLEELLRLFLLNRLASFALQSFLLSPALSSILTLVAEAFSQIKKEKKKTRAKLPSNRGGTADLRALSEPTRTYTHKRLEQQIAD